MVDQSGPVTTSEQQAVPVAQSPASIWLSPACEITAHDGRTWANPAPATACDECGDPWVEYVRADLALPCKSGEDAEAVIVTKADRDLFALLCPDMAALIYGGDLDTFRQMQGIVQHRLSAIDATQTREAETRSAIVRDLIAERRSYNEDSPTWRAFGFCIDIAEKAALNARDAA